MKIILLRDVKGIGKKFDVKEVKDGYARNFLLVRGMAEVATKGALDKLEVQKKIWEAEHQKLVERLKAEAAQIESVVLNFKMKVGEKGEAFGSVTKKDIEMELSQKGFKDLKIELEKSIKTIGEHSVPVDLGEGIKGKLKIITAAE